MASTRDQPIGEIGTRRHRIALENPGPYVPDEDGGFTQTWEPLDPPTVDASINLASMRDLERLAPGTVISQATHVIECRYVPGVTTKTRVKFHDRIFNVSYLKNREERNIDLVLICQEVIE